MSKRQDPALIILTGCSLSRKDSYDAYRESFLHGRKPLLEAVVARIEPSHGKAVWVDMGGGTGWNVQYLESLLQERGLGRLREVFSRIYVVDL
jgi:betaine lipid synthase